MKFRLGAITGTPSAGEGADTAGIYFSLGSSREDLTQLRAAYYRGVKIWPEEGASRIMSLRLSISEEDANLLHKCSLASNDYLSGGAYLQTKIDGRYFVRSSARANIRWDNVSKRLLFLNNNGPWANKVARGDYITLEFGIPKCYKQILHEDALSELTVVSELITPLTTCSVYIAGLWRDKNGNFSKSYQGAAAIINKDSKVVHGCEAYVLEKKKWYGKKKKYWTEVDQTISGIDYPFYIAFKGHPANRMAAVYLPEEHYKKTFRVTDIEVMQ